MTEDDDSDDENLSMCNNGLARTPQESHSDGHSPRRAAVAELGRLSLEDDRREKISIQHAASVQIGCKRGASEEFATPPPKQSPIPRDPTSTKDRRKATSAQRGHRQHTKPATRKNVNHVQAKVEPFDQATGAFDKAKFHQDSGYGSLPPSRQATFAAMEAAIKPQVATPPHTSVGPPVPVKPEAGIKSQVPPTPPPPNNIPPMFAQTAPKRESPYANIALEPPSSPISQQQLAAEIKGIYAGLVMVEAKCINIDTAQASEKERYSELTQEQYMALVALHRTLLYEHHDFLMATQHPSASPFLKGLATKYSMPARMWKHGIHGFLEVLRKKRPASQEYMLAFVYLAYQMMALLYETVEGFTDTWIECLGDLSRYRMAIEDDREVYSQWLGVAAYWYLKSSDRNPNTGRLSHHLGILEKPSLKKLYFYVKSLTAPMPFLEGHESVKNLFRPMLDGSQRLEENSFEHSTMLFHAHVYFKSEVATQEQHAIRSLNLLKAERSARVREYGLDLTIANIGLLMQYGSQTDGLFQAFFADAQKAIRALRPSATSAVAPRPQKSAEDAPHTLFDTSSPMLVFEYVHAAFDLTLKHGKDRASMLDILPSLHALLVWMHGLHTLGTRTQDEDDRVLTISSLAQLQQFSMVGLCNCLNTLTQFESIPDDVFTYARNSPSLDITKLGSTSPLPDDYSLRGMVWTQYYYPPNFFPEEPDADIRAAETEETKGARVRRVYSLALFLAYHGVFEFDETTKSFSERVSKQTTPPNRLYELLGADCEDDAASMTAQLSTKSDSDGWSIISGKGSDGSKTSSKAPSKASAKGRKTAAKRGKNVKVYDQDAMEMDVQ